MISKYEEAGKVFKIGLVFNDSIKKVSFGAKAGGQNLRVKINDPKAREAFADRQNCSQKNDKTKPGYWSCRLPRYAKLLGLKSNFSGFW